MTASALSRHTSPFASREQGQGRSDACCPTVHGTPVQTLTELEHEPHGPAEGDQRFGARHAPAGGQLSESSAGRRPYSGG